ncbi:MAG: hypothetical protein ACTHVS_09945, partial [Senegalia sp. (in: firmicutes)]
YYNENYDNYEDSLPSWSKETLEIHTDDRRDENSFASVAWLFGKHDRPWKEREIFGKTRYMNANGLKRKFDIEKYVEMIEALDK